MTQERPTCSTSPASSPSTTATTKRRAGATRRAAGCASRLGDWSGVAATDANLAILAEFGGDYPRAFELNERSLALRREIGDRRGIGIGEMNAGYYGLLMGRTDESLARVEVALAISREIGDRAMISHSLRTLADGHRNAGNYPRAAELYAEAIRAYRDLGNEFELGFILEDVGVLCARSLAGVAGFELLGAAEAAAGAGRLAAAAGPRGGAAAPVRRRARGGRIRGRRSGDRAGPWHVTRGGTWRGRDGLRGASQHHNRRRDALVRLAHRVGASAARPDHRLSRLAGPSVPG